MKKKVVIGIIIILTISLISVISTYFYIINKYNNIGKNIDKKIETKKEEITKKSEELKSLKATNEKKKLQEDNMNKYIQTLEEKVKEYEK